MTGNGQRSEVSGCHCLIEKPCNSTFSHLKRRSKRGFRGDFIRSLGSHEQRSGNGSAGKRGLLLRHPIGRGRHLPTPRALRHTTCTAVVTVSIVNFETVTEIFRLATGATIMAMIQPCTEIYTERFVAFIRPPVMAKRTFYFHFSACAAIYINSEFTKVKHNYCIKI
ncbi:hypothetical protein SDC9_155192 [bioreactor metagenome]|uniref:Uncharacterized protein n=1 Tax=bioreactor metagenome TaxID=1076179 RepID=A0A645F2A2_9ZZZZ